jgi:SAM-dependent methyltransferase
MSALVLITAPAYEMPTASAGQDHIINAGGGRRLHRPVGRAGPVLLEDPAMTSNPAGSTTRRGAQRQGQVREDRSDPYAHHVSDELSDHVAENRRYWDAMADDWISSGEQRWANEACWGEWRIPNTDLPLLAEEMSGQRAIELGCGTGYVSGWMRRRGASVYAIDNSAAQLATARRLSALHGLDDIEWVHGNAENVGQPHGSFDFAISEYGAAIWCEPHSWITEAHRLLRPGGELVFLGNHPLPIVCSPVDGSLPVTQRLERAYFDLGRLDWRDAADEPGGIEFNLTISAWIRLFHDIGFDLVDYIEIKAPESATGSSSMVTADWARRFPSEQVWRIRKQ